MSESVETQSVIHEAAVAAAEWWARFLSGELGSKNYGAEDGMSAILPYVAVSTESEEENVVEKFKRALVTRIERMAEHTSYITISTDYGPEDMLRNALIDASAKNYSAFPWKTLMSVTPESVTVAEGYGAQMKPVWGERPCTDCRIALGKEECEDGFGTSYVYSEATGKRIETRDNPEYLAARDRGEDTRLILSFISEAADEPCRTCGGATVLKPKAVA